MDPTTVDPTTTSEFVVIFCLVDMFNINNFFPAPTTIDPTTVDPTTESEFFHAFCLFVMFNIMFNIKNKLFFSVPTTLGPTTVDPTTKGKFVVVVCLFDMFNIIHFLFQCQQYFTRPLLILPL